MAMHSSGGSVDDPPRKRVLLTRAFALLAFAACHAPPSRDEIVSRSWDASLTPRAETAPPAPVPAPPDKPEASPATRDVEWTLESILDQIRVANPTLAVARARLGEALAAREESWAAYYPTLTLSQGYVNTDNPAEAFGILLNQRTLSLGAGFDPTPGTTDNWRTEARLDVALFEPGRRESYRAAESGAMAAGLAEQAAGKRLLNAGIQAWLRLRAALALRDVARRRVEIVADSLDKTRIRQREGAALRADVLRLEVRLAAARQEQGQADLGIRRAEAELQALMGLRADEPVRLADETVEIAASVPQSLDGALARAVGQRLDLQAKAEALRAQDYSLAAAESRYLPRLVAFGAYDIDGEDLSFDTDLDSYLVGVALEWQLSGRTGPRIDRASAEAARTRAELRALAAEITQEVSTALASLDVATRNAELARAAAEAADEAYRIVAAAHEAGGATITDLLEAENARDEAAVGQVVAAANLEIARARLAASVGETR